MTVTQELSWYREYGETIIDSLNLVSNNPDFQKADWLPSELPETLQRLEKFAKNTQEKSTSPVKIGIMGEFSSGKTLLIGSLIGYAGALADGETPTTGNVTAIHLIQQSEFKTTEVKEFRVEYLSHEKVKECLQEMLKEAEKRGTGLGSDLLSSLRNLYSSNTINTQEILKWCEKAWNQTQSLEMRYLLRELVIFVKTYSVYGEGICGKTYNIDQFTAKQGLKMAASPLDMLALQFQDVLPNISNWHNSEKLLVEDLQNSFSLIRIIEVYVKISKEIWDLSSLQGTNDFVLLDFPGLGAAQSSVRDTILSLQAMEEVQTILLLIDGRKSGAATAAKIRKMLEDYRKQDLKNRILVGVGRFNQIPLKVKDEEKIDNLLAEPFLSKEMVLEELEILRDTIANTRNLTTKEENIVLLSQLYGLTKLAERSTLIQVCTSEFLPELDRPKRPEESKRREKWKELSEMLPSNDILSKQLSDYAFDGGISRLRALLTAHVAEYGMKQLLEDLKREAADPLREEQKKLKNILTQIPDYMPKVENPVVKDLREAIESLLKTYRRFKEDLEKQPFLENSNGFPISDLVKEELTCKIFDWSQWSALLNRTNRGVISVEEEGFVEDMFFSDLKDDGNNSIPTKSDDFYRVFMDTIEQMQYFVTECTRGVITSLFKELSEKVETQSNQLNAILEPVKEADIKNKFTNDSNTHVRLFRTLSLALNPVNQLQKGIIDRSGLNENNSIICNDSLFPLARQDDTHSTSQIFDWSPERKESVEPRPFNHQIAVLRLRDEIITTASLQLVEQTSKLNKKVKESFSSVLRVIIENLEQLLGLKYEPLLKYIASAENTSQSETPYWLETLSEISTISSSDQKFE